MESKYLIDRRLRMLGIKEPEPKKQKKKILFRSGKRKIEQKEYVAIVKEMLSENPNCEIKVEGCQGRATGLHHKKRRDKEFLNKKYLMRACDSCNLWVELHPLEAMEKGFVVSKFKKDLVPASAGDNT